MSLTVEELMSEEEGKARGETGSDGMEGTSLEQPRRDDGSEEPEKNQLHCSCLQPYDPDKFYVGCDDCGRWFHGDCVGLDPVKAATLKTWSCSVCGGREASSAEEEEKKTENQLLCLCQTPYNESQFYVGCDSCEGWFHPRCVGITQTDAENMREYHCPPCLARKASLPLSREDYPQLWALLEALSPASKAPPIQLRPVQSRLERMDYHRLGDLRADLLRIFSLALRDSPASSAGHKAILELQSRFHQLYSQLEAELKKEGREFGRRERSRGFSESSRTSASGDPLGFNLLNDVEFE